MPRPTFHARGCAVRTGRAPKDVCDRTKSRQPLPSDPRDETPPSDVFQKDHKFRKESAIVVGDCGRGFWQKPYSPRTLNLPEMRHPGNERILALPRRFGMIFCFSKNFAGGSIFQIGPARLKVCRADGPLRVCPVGIPPFPESNPGTRTPICSRCVDEKKVIVAGAFGCRRRVGFRR